MYNWLCQFLLKPDSQQNLVLNAVLIFNSKLLTDASGFEVKFELQFSNQVPCKVVKLCLNLYTGMNSTVEFKHISIVN